MARNDGMVENLAGDFQRRQEPNFAWKSLVSATLALPGLRGAWCASDFDESGDLYDLTGQGHQMTYQGDPVFCHENLIPYCYYDGVGDYHTRADAAWMDIIGNESYVHADCQGLTLGGWWYVETFDAGANDGLIGKWDPGTNNRSYVLFIGTPAVQGPSFSISRLGTAATVDTCVGQLITVQTWFFAAGRFTPSTTVDAWTGGVLQGETASTFTHDTAVTASATIFNSNVNLDIASYDMVSYPLDGKMAICWMCAEAISDSIIRAYWEQTRAMFNK